jgi:putative FmdB family regulatory protein
VDWGSSGYTAVTMPIYDYLCTSGHRVDVVQKFADEALTKCEVCGKSAQRVLHAPAVHFKGKGFYATDYGKGKSANGDKASDSGNSSDSGSKEAAASSSGGGSDGNSSSKSESKGSDSKGSESKSSDSKSSVGDSSSSRKSDSKAAS